ncbi:IS3 family transposase [Streptomyces sp. INA 01156]
MPYRTACRALGVSESWFYKWRDRPPTAREVRRRQLAEEIEEILHDSGGTHGSPKVFIQLMRRGWQVSVNTVAKVMAELGPAGRKVPRRRSPARPGKRPAAADFVRRDFTAGEPDLVRRTISPRSKPARARCTWRRSSTCSPAACSATQWPPVMTPTWSSRP